MLIRQIRHLAATGRALDEALLDEEGFIDLLDGAGVFANGGGDGGDAHRAALELIDDGQQDLAVDEVEAVAVDVQRLQGIARYLQVDAPVALDLCKVAHTAQQGVGNTWRATRATRYLGGRVGIDGLSEDACRAQDDALQRLGIVVFQMQVDTEASAQGCREQARARRGTHERERIQIYLYRARAGAAVNHDVDAVVLHRRVEVLLHDGRQAMDLVDEQHILRLQGGQDARQITGLVQHGTAGDLEAHAQLVGNDIRERRLTQSGRAVQERMVQRFAAITRRLHEDLQVLHHLCLAGEVLKVKRAQGVLEVGRSPSPIPSPVRARGDWVYKCVEFLVHVTYF